MTNSSMQERGQLARRAGITLSATSTADRNQALATIADALDAGRAEILSANRRDYERSVSENLAPPLLKRLTFDDHKVDDVISGIRSLIELPDPVGHTQMAKELDNGLDLYRVSCPIGVIGIIFESRPDAFVQISSLCLKSGNAVLLKGGREALETNRALNQIIHDASVASGMPEGWIQNLESRDEVTEMLALDDSIDLILPRGSNAFVKYIMDHSNIPVMGHADGICHVYVDEAADLPMAVDIAVDAKSQYVAVCNAAETLLVHRAIAPKFLPALKEKMDAAGVHLLGDAEVQAIIGVDAATEADWSTEYLDYILSIKLVSDLDEAIPMLSSPQMKLPKSGLPPWWILPASLSIAPAVFPTASASASVPRLASAPPSSTPEGLWA